MDESTKQRLQTASKMPKKPVCHSYVSEIRGKQLLARLEHVKASGGVTIARKYYNGILPTARQAIIGKCAECMGWYDDGLRDCEMPDCVLYHWMPYRAGKTRKIRKDRQKGAA